MANIVKRAMKKLVPKGKVTAVQVPVMQGELLKGKFAFIIGGSGGIGSEIAKAYVDNGCKVVVSGTNEDKLKSICQKLGCENAKYVVANVKNVADVENAVSKAVEAFGRLDIFVHCAGVHCHDAFGSVSEETWDNVMDVNLKSMYFSCQAVANYMIENGVKGHILTVSSASSAKPGWTPYEISKNAVKALTLGFADRLIRHGIVVNSIAPGPVATAMLGKENCDDITWCGNPTGRMSTPREIANWAVFMVSDMGNMVVGDTFYVSGGSGTVCLDK